MNERKKWMKRKVSRFQAGPSFPATRQKKGPQAGELSKFPLAKRGKWLHSTSETLRSLVIFSRAESRNGPSIFTYMRWNVGKSKVVTGEAGEFFGILQLTIIQYFQMTLPCETSNCATPPAVRTLTGSHSSNKFSPTVDTTIACCGVPGR
jgi:hypothetical protein